jgi:RNA polymerase primary sigma factor
MNNKAVGENGDSGFRRYADEIARIALLTPADEIALARRIKQGDAAARALMIRSNLRLVVKIALGYTRLGLPLLDLIEEGNIGLMAAIDRFDPDNGAKISTYAVWWIKQRIKLALQNQGKIIRLPVHFGDKALRIHRISAQMSETLGRAPSDEELSEEVGLDRAEVAHLRSACLPLTSLDAPIVDSAETELGETLGDEREQTPFDRLGLKDLYARIAGALHLLTERERKIVSERFGLDGVEPKTLEDVGLELGITRERVRQVQNAALAKLRGAITIHDIDARVRLGAAA